MKKILLLVISMACLFAEAQTIGVYCDTPTIEPNQETTLRFQVSGGFIQYFCYTDGTDYCMVEMSSNIYTKTVRPSTDTRYWITYVSTGEIDPQHKEVYIHVVGSSSTIQITFDLPESCYYTDAPINLRPLFWSNVPNYDQIVKFSGPGVSGDFFIPGNAGVGRKSIKAFFFLNNAENGIIKDIEVIGGTGVDEFTDLSVSVYPNPANDRLTVEVQEVEVIGTVEIYNIMGILIHSQDIYSNKGEIDVSNLPSGVYSVRSASFNEKFVKP